LIVAITVRTKARRVRKMIRFWKLNLAVYIFTTGL